MRYQRFFLCRVLVLAIATLFSGSLYANTLSKQCVKANKQTLFPILKPAIPSELVAPKEALRLTADDVSGEGQDKIIATGSVVAEQDGNQLNANQIIYNRKTSTIDIPNNFILSDDNKIIHGQALIYNLAKHSGNAKKIQFQAFNQKTNLQGSGGDIDFYGNNYLQLKEAKVNTCLAGDDSWYIWADQIDADMNKGIGVAKQAKLVFKGIPILYTPWFDFPLNGNRKSGFLAPSINWGSNGLELALPYYFNLAPNYDATVTTHLYGLRGLAWQGQFRYLFPNSEGQISGQWLPEDRLDDRHNRYVIHINHEQNWGQYVHFGVAYNRASDDDYYRDLGSRLDSASNANLLQKVWVNAQYPLWGGLLDSRLEVLQYQTLQDKAHLLPEPYRYTPQWNINWQKSSHWATWSVISQLTHFTHSKKQNGWRVVMYPSVLFNFANEWGFVRPKVGIHMTRYQLDGFGRLASRTVSRAVPILSVDSGVTFERAVTIAGTPLIQTLEPRLYYLYIPSAKQNELPNFDSSENDFDFDQLFRENRFSGQDRINSASLISFALQTHFYNAKNGVNEFSAGIGQRYYLKKDDVDLTGNIQERTRHRSDLLLFANGLLTHDISVQSNWHYNQDLLQTESFSSGISYHPDIGKVLSMRFHYRRHAGLLNNESKQVDVAVQWPITSQLYMIARQNYSLSDKQPLDQLLGVEYRSKCGCWSSNVFVQRYAVDKNQFKNAIFFQLRLKDLGGVGISPMEELRRSIPGYSPINEVNQ